MGEIDTKINLLGIEIDNPKWEKDALEKGHKFIK